MKAVKHFFAVGSIPDGVNNTIIVLIPKTKDADDLKDFRPISLCNVLYKMIAKCIVNRLRPMLQHLISENQSAFLPGRLISDNALIAFECFHHIQKNKKADDNYCAYKLDLAKAYDRVDWVYLQGILLSFGFDSTWVKQVMACVSSVNFAVKINGELSENFKPTRGLRQGDPLSPYLFLFVAEGLSKILQRAVHNQELLELKCNRGAPGISHLLFADDSLLFFKATSQQAMVVKQCIAKFEKSTGQLLSPSKCSILFSNACPDQDQREIKSILSVSHSSFEEKYLGLPTPEGRMKARQFQPIKDRFSKRMSNWNEKYLSMGGKEVLIKSVAQALPTYVMGIFELPASFHEDYMKWIRNFWWGEDENHRKVHWSSWDNLIQPKQHGGMGFRDTRLFNQALLARLTSPESSKFGSKTYEGHLLSKR